MSNYHMIFAILLTLALSGSLSDAMANETLQAITVDLTGLPERDEPVYQVVWNIINSLTGEMSTSLVWVIEMVESPYSISDGFVLSGDEKGGFRHVMITVDEPNPRYPALPSSSQLFQARVSSATCSLPEALDAVCTMGNGRFVWMYDADSKVVNIVEKQLTDISGWYLNRAIDETLPVVPDVVAGINWLAEHYKATPVVEWADGWKPFLNNANEIAVRGSTVREALNSILGARSDVYRYYTIFPQLHTHGETDTTVVAALFDDGNKWELCPKPEGYGPFLEECAEIDRTLADKMGVGWRDR